MEIVQLSGFHHTEVTKQGLLRTGSSLDVHMNLVIFLTGLGGNYDNTTSSRSTVDTGRTGVFQYGDGLNVIGVERATHDTIDYINRLTTSGNRTCTTDTDLGSLTRLTTCVRNRQTCYFTLEHVTDITGGDVGQFLCVHRDNG